MWKLCLSWSEEKQAIVAKLPESGELPAPLETKELPEQLKEMEAESLFVDDAEVTRFMNCVKERKAEAYQGFEIAQRKNAQLDIELTNNDMLASMKITGAYGGRGLRGNEIVQALAHAHVTKGINKLALKKVLAVSQQLKAGETFLQPVAQGRQPVKGKDAQFTPLVPDITKRVLKPKQSKSDADKIDMRNLGETITVEKGDPVMKREPATKGTPGYTVQGKVIPPQAGKDTPLKSGKGTAVSSRDPNLLVASQSGMPLIKGKNIEVDDALCMNSVGVATGHIRFKGNVVISGDIEAGMVVKATGSITVGGFIESAEVQAQGDILVGKGIIGHTVSDGEPRSCSVKTKASIKANYAQYSELQAGDDIELAVHSMSNEIKCGRDLLVMDSAQRNGTLSGGHAMVGGKIQCVQLGVEGDTATHVQAFARYPAYKEKLAVLKEEYKLAQAETMEVIREELEFKKTPKSERPEAGQERIDAMKADNSAKLERYKGKLDLLEAEFDALLSEATVQATEKVFTRVTVRYGDEIVTTKRTHGGSTFSFNQYEIKCAMAMDEEALSTEPL